jgi:hypothetical protein
MRGDGRAVGRLLWRSRVWRGYACQRSRSVVFHVHERLLFSNALTWIGSTREDAIDSRSFPGPHYERSPNTVEAYDTRTTCTARLNLVPFNRAERFLASGLLDLLDSKQEPAFSQLDWGGRRG